jgi:hypothetical protein
MPNSISHIQLKPRPEHFEEASKYFDKNPEKVKFRRKNKANNTGFSFIYTDRKIVAILPGKDNVIFDRPHGTVFFIKKSNEWQPKHTVDTSPEALPWDIISDDKYSPKVLTITHDDWKHMCYTLFNNKQFSPIKISAYESNRISFVIDNIKKLYCTISQHPGPEDALDLSFNDNDERDLFRKTIQNYTNLEDCVHKASENGIKIKKAIDQNGNEYVVKIQYLSKNRANNPNVNSRGPIKQTDEEGFLYDIGKEKKISHSLNRSTQWRTTTRQPNSPETAEKKIHYAHKSYLTLKKFDKTLYDLRKELVLEDNTNTRIEKKFDYAIQLALQVHNIHAGQGTIDGKKISHGDIKSNNIMTDQEDRIQLIDFGLSEFFPHSRKDTQQWIKKHEYFPYHSTADTDHFNPVYRDIFALLRTLYCSKKICEKYSVKGFFTINELHHIDINKSAHEKLSHLLDTTQGYLRADQRSDALDVAATLITHYDHSFSNQDETVSETTQRINEHKSTIVRELLKESLSKALTSLDVIKRDVAQTLLKELENTTDVKVLKDTLLTAIRVFSHHNSRLFGRWTNRLGFLPTTYRNSANLLMKAATVLGCENEAKLFLYKKQKKVPLSDQKDQVENDNEPSTRKNAIIIKDKFRYQYFKNNHENLNVTSTNLGEKTKNAYRCG